MSELKITAQVQNERTVLSSLYFTAPLKIAKPFYSQEKNGPTKLMVMQASAGLLEGDHNEISVSLGRDANLEYTGQSFTKVFNSPEGTGSSQNTFICMEENSSLIFSPLPVVPFENSVYSAKTEIHLKQSSRLIYSDIFCCGRKERGEIFRFKSFVSRTAIYIEEKMVFLDNTRFFPKQVDLFSTGFFENFSHTGFVYLYGYEISDLSDFDTSNISVAVSSCLDGNVIRIFSNNADSIKNFVSELSTSLKML